MLDGKILYFDNSVIDPITAQNAGGRIKVLPREAQGSARSRQSRISPRSFGRQTTTGVMV